MAYQLDPKTREAMDDAIRGLVDALDHFEHIEFESANWGTPDVELAVIEARRAATRVISSISNWTGAVTVMAESGQPVNPFLWLEQIATPNGTFIIDAANTSVEIVEDLFEANATYHRGDTLKALDQVNTVYKRWGSTVVNALIGAMRAQLLMEPYPSSDQQPNTWRPAPAGPTKPAFTPPGYIRVDKQLLDELDAEQGKPTPASPPQVGEYLAGIVLEPNDGKFVPTSEPFPIPNLMDASEHGDGTEDLGPAPGW